MVYGSEDDDLLHRIKKITNVKCVNSNKYICIHQYHIGGTFDVCLNKNKLELISKNKNLFLLNKNNSIIYCSPYIIGLTFNINSNTCDINNIIIFFESLKILIDNYNIIIYSIINCIPDSKLENIINKYKNKYANNIHFIYLNTNFKIYIAFIMGIKLLINNLCDFIFYCNFDFVFTDFNILNKYIEISIKHNIGFIPFTDFDTDLQNINDFLCIKSSNIYMLTRKYIHQLIYTIFNT